MGGEYILPTKYTPYIQLLLNLAHMETFNVSLQGHKQIKLFYCAESKKGLLRSQIQLELLGLIPWNSVESELGCTSKIYFDAEVTQRDLDVTKNANTRTSVIAAKQTVKNEVYFFH